MPGLTGRSCQDAVVRRVAPALTTLVLGLGIGACAVVGPWLLAASMLVVVVALASGWPTLLGLPTQRGSVTVLALCGAIGVLVTLLTSEPPRDDPLRWLAPVLALSIVITFTHQLLRRDMRPRLVESVTGVVSGVVVLQLGVGWLPAAGLDVSLVLTGLATLICCAGLHAVARRSRALGLLSLVVGVAVGMVCAALLPGLAAVNGALVGVCVAVVVICIDRLFAKAPRSQQAGVAIGAAGLCTTGMVIYLLASVVV